VRIIDGVLKKGMKVKLMGPMPSTRWSASACRGPRRNCGRTGAGRNRLLHGAIKEVADTRVGDTVTDDKAEATPRLPDFRPAQSVVFAGFFPVDAARFEDLRDAMGKLRLNDASFSYEMETSAALGFGFRCGFLGLLHLEIIRERIEREFNVDIITTAPSGHLQGQPARRHPDRTAQSRRHAGSDADPEHGGTLDRGDDPRARRLSGLDPQSSARTAAAGRSSSPMPVRRAMVVYDLPLNEVVFDFYDRLKSVSRAMPRSTTR
jgi:GTP-binding protein LepA